MSFISEEEWAERQAEYKEKIEELKIAFEAASSNSEKEALLEEIRTLNESITIMSDDYSDENGLEVDFNEEDEDESENTDIDLIIESKSDSEEGNQKKNNGTNEFWARLALACCFYVFGKDGSLEKTEQNVLLDQIEKEFGINYLNDFKGIYEFILEKWRKGDFKNILDEIINIADFWATNPILLKFKIMHIIVQSNNELGRKESEREDAKSRFEVYKIFDISVDEYNEWLEGK